VEEHLHSGTLPSQINPFPHGVSLGKASAPFGEVRRAGPLAAAGNVASATTGEVDADPGNNQDSASITVLPAPRRSVYLPVVVRED
jgi:hypothetical protein